MGLLAGRILAPHTPWLPIGLRAGQASPGRGAVAGKTGSSGAGAITDQREKMGRLGVMAFFSGLALLPDLDYVGVMMGVENSGPCGHRGATHSLLPALLITWIAAAFAPRLNLPRWRTAALCGLVVASHALLDAMTVTSRGVPLLWPLTFTRFEMPWRPIPNAPCGLAYLSREGLRVASTEFLQFLPILVMALWPRATSAPPLDVPRPARRPGHGHQGRLTQHVS